MNIRGTKAAATWIRAAAVLIALLALMAAAFPTAVFGDALIDDGEEVPTNIFVMVSADDGGVNFRSGPGTEYDKLMEGMIPNGLVLHVSRMKYNCDGITWGLTVYDGMEGWIALTEVTELDDAELPPDLPEDPEDLDLLDDLVFPDDVSDVFFAKVISEDGLIVRMGPGEDYAPAMNGSIPTDTELFVAGVGNDDAGNEWYFIMYGETLGWVRSDGLEALDLSGYDNFWGGSGSSGDHPGGSGNGNSEKIKLHKVTGGSQSGGTAFGSSIVIFIAAGIAAAVVIAVLIVLLTKKRR